jgi:alkylation response protein AidB-like acyl-CoA dehydrogenase
LTAADPDAFRGSCRSWIAAHREAAPPLVGEFTAERVEAWRRWSRQIFEGGFAGITWPQEYGGRGLSARHQAIWLEEIAFAQVPDHLGVIGLGMAGPTIISWGTAEQKERLLRPILDCSEIWCQGFSEPACGSDLAAVQTAARPEGDYWVVNGQKVWSSFAHIARWSLLLARTDRSASRHAGLTMLVADLRSDGVEVRPLRQITGDPEFNEIFLTDARLAREMILGQPGDGWRVAMTTLSHERGTYGIGLAAALEAEYRSALSQLRDAGPPGESPLSSEVVRDELAAIWVELQALIRTNARTLEDIERSGSPGPQATISKLRWSLLNQRLATLMARELGLRGTGAVPGDEVGDHWRYTRLRSRGNTIEAGTTEVLRNIIAERVLGLPRLR